jgi:peptide/nickel transport system substrate-binding protein
LQLALAGASASGLTLLAGCGGGSSSPTAGESAATSSSSAVAASPQATVAGTSAAATTSTSDKPTKVTIAQGVDVRTFDPNEDTRSFEVFRNVFDNLLTHDQDLKLVPSLAESWNNIDPTTWEFKIRQGVTFHDGTPMTAKDIEFTWTHVLDPNTKSRIYSFISTVDHVKAVDDFTIQIVTKTPFPALPTIVNYVGIVPAEKYQSMGPDKFAVAPIGTGPYRFVEWVKDEHFSFERYDDHWRGPAAITNVEFRPIPEDATRVAALQAGEVDIAPLIPITNVPTIESDASLSIRTVRSLFTIFVGMNTFKAPFTDVRVRQALNYAVDVDSLIKNLLDGHGYPLGQICAPAVFGYNPDVKPYPYDPEKAKSLLAEAGFPDGFSTTLDTPSGQYLQDVEMSQAIAGQLAKVGVKVEVKAADFNEYFDRWLAKKIEGLYFLGNTATTMDVDAVLGSHFDSKRRGLYYNSPESDDLIHQGQAEFDVAKRQQIYNQEQVYLHDQAPWIFLYNQENIYGAAKSVDWKPVADDRIWVYEMKRI